MSTAIETVRPGIDGVAAAAPDLSFMLDGLARQVSHTLDGVATGWQAAQAQQQQAAEALASGEWQGRELVVLTPFRAQRALIRRALQARGEAHNHQASRCIPE